MIDLTEEEIESILEMCRETCQGFFYIGESGCNEGCERFENKLKEIRREAQWQKKDIAMTFHSLGRSLITTARTARKSSNA